MKTIKARFLFLLVTMLMLFASHQAYLYAQSEAVIPTDARALQALEDHFTFLIASDLGRTDIMIRNPWRK